MVTVCSCSASLSTDLTVCRPGLYVVWAIERVLVLVISRGSASQRPERYEKLGWLAVLPGAVFPNSDTSRFKVHAQK